MLKMICLMTLALGDYHSAKHWLGKRDSNVDFVKARCKEAKASECEVRWVEKPEFGMTAPGAEGIMNRVELWGKAKAPLKFEKYDQRNCKP